MGRLLWIASLVLVGCGGIAVTGSGAPSEAGGPDVTDHDAALDGTVPASDARDEHVGAVDSSSGGADARAEAADARTDATICNPPFFLCGKTCVNIQGDPLHCGSCGNACAPGMACIGGTCGGCGCPQGTTPCDSSCTCVDLTTDPKNCGACASLCQCPGAQAGVCANGACNCPCAAGLALCGTSCVDLETNLQNCGQCGYACPTCTVCSLGACVGACPPGEILCSIQSVCACIDPTTDPLHCGAVGTCQGPSAGMVCTPGEICSGGICVLRDASPD
jgi:hypothetical protein